ncbi:50S ribosomal protein L4 [Frankliniella fusca]|uniref:50S ribosomal protein L4 n=1 Tax=Frankliniella fusca TaxID=407009 RepID=A0AAE1H4J5_9NEOP|nr:50S ribosomal protein L4 [Frankliniella fusca]
MKYRVYLDETWCFLYGSGLSKTWQDKDVRSYPTRKIGTGRRRVWSSSRKPKPGDDYHGDMNGEVFHRWFSKDLVPNIEEPTIIIMDNAQYHFCQATPSLFLLKVSIK